MVDFNLMFLSPTPTRSTTTPTLHSLESTILTFEFDILWWCCKMVFYYTVLHQILFVLLPYLVSVGVPYVLLALKRYIESFFPPSITQVEEMLSNTLSGLEETACKEALSGLEETETAFKEAFPVSRETTETVPLPAPTPLSTPVEEPVQDEGGSDETARVSRKRRGTSF